MKNYAAIIIALTAYDLSGQALGLSRFLFEPVIRPLDYRPPDDYNASRGQGGKVNTEHDDTDKRFDNRFTPNIQGNPSAYGHNVVDFNATYDYNDGTYDQNSSTYNMSGGEIYHGSDLPLKQMAVGNSLNGLSERWHSPYDPDYVRQNPGRFTPTDNRYNPNLTLHGNIDESPWEFFAAPQISMDDPQNNLRSPMGFMKSDGSEPHTRGMRLTTLNWDTLAHEGDMGNLSTVMERIDSIEMGGFYQDGMAVDATAGLGTGTLDLRFPGQHTCGGHNPDPAGAPTMWHFWEQRHFSSLSRAGLDAKRSIPLDGIYAYIPGAGQHDFDFGGSTDMRKRRHWDWKTGDLSSKAVFNVGWCWEATLFTSTPVPLSDCTAANNPAPGGTGVFYVERGVSFNERYQLFGGEAANTGNGNQTADPGGKFGITVTGTTSRQSRVNGVQIYADSQMELEQNATGAFEALAGHPTELHGSSLSPWNEAFGYDLSRFFGDFYVEPSVWSINMNDVPGGGPGGAADRLTSSPDFLNPLDKGNQISTRSMSDVLRMGDMRRKIRHINRFPQAGLDYLFQSESQGTAVFTQ